MSFASEAKNNIAALPVKSKCCKKAELYGLFYSQSDFLSEKLKFSTDDERVAALCSYLTKSVFGFESIFEESDQLTAKGIQTKGFKFISPKASDIEKIKMAFASDNYLIDTLFECENCARYFLRGLFLSVGLITNPRSAYHLEFTVIDEKKVIALRTLFTNVGIPVKVTSRKGIFAIYIKESEVIEDFFTYIGAQQISLKIMDIKIMREIRNNENRRNNCDTANIYKATEASVMQLKAINAIISNNLFNKLPEELAQTAKLRIDNPEISMNELAGLHEPPITKSGVNHRLTKIIDFYKKNIEQ